ncbi:MAG: hypothetical protein J6C87_02840 [Bacteroides sp.]|nr:hypothetical protein [Bacteroides sp.]
MRIKTLVAAVLLSSGVSGVYAQTDKCNTNSSISHEAVKARNYKDAYEPCMAVLKDCPTLKFYTYTDAEKILEAFLGEIKDRNSADYQKYFTELMDMFDQRIKYLPELNKKLKPTQQRSATAELGSKAVAYLQFAPKADLNQAYAWLKESVDAEKGESKGEVLNAFMDVTMKKVQADKAHTEAFFQDYLNATKYIEEAIAAATKPNVKNYLEALKGNFVAMFINSGVADCESLQNIYGPQVEENKADSTFLKKAISVLKMMKCTESEAYFKASDYMYRIDPTADAAVGVAMMQYKKGNYVDAVKYFDEALTMETDDAKKAEIAYAAAGSLLAVKKYAQAKSYCQKAISFNDKFAQAYILLAQAYGSNPNWSDEAALNKCTYFVVLDKLAKAKSVDPSVAEQVDELMATYRRHTPEAKDLFMLGIKSGDRVTVGGWIGESTTVR